MSINSDSLKHFNNDFGHKEKPSMVSKIYSYSNLLKGKIYKYYRNEVLAKGYILLIKGMNQYSPWILSDQITEQAECREIKPIETYKILDLTQFLYRKSWREVFNCIPYLFRTVHVINDKDLIKQHIQRGRSGQQYQIYPSFIETILDHQNMLLCDDKSHLKYRAPFEKVFKKENIESNYINEIAKFVLLNSATPSLRSTSSLFEKISGSASVEFAQKRWSYPEFASSVNTLQRASEHTTSQTEMFISRMFAKFPQWAFKIREEWEERFGPIGKGYLQRDNSNQNPEDRLIIFVKGGIWNNKEIEPSPSLHAFLLEVLRLFPVIPQVIRIAAMDFMIDDTAVRENDLVSFNIMGSHRDSAIWENPTEFLPERFLNDGNASVFRNDYGLSNFSFGSQACIGKNLALYYLVFFTALKALQDTVNQGHRNTEYLPFTTESLGLLMCLNEKKDLEHIIMWNLSIVEPPKDGKPYKITAPFLNGILEQALWTCSKSLTLFHPRKVKDISN